MTALGDALSELLWTDPERVERLVRRLTEERRGVWIDVGGLRGAWRGKEIVLERYVVLECSPKELIDD